MKNARNGQKNSPEHSLNISNSISNCTCTHVGSGTTDLKSIVCTCIEAYDVECYGECSNREHNEPKTKWTRRKNIGLQPLCVSLFLTAVLESVVPYPLLLCAAACVAGAVVVVGASFILLKAFGFSSNDTKKWNFYYFLSFALRFSVQSLLACHDKMVACQMEWNGKKYTKSSTSAIKHPYACTTMQTPTNSKTQL